jgi:hypothetical protein
MIIGFGQDLATELNSNNRRNGPLHLHYCIAWNTLHIVLWVGKIEIFVGKIFSLKTLAQVMACLTLAG